jgi:alpha/beta superfamily hydrolase
MYALSGLVLRRTDRGVGRTKAAAAAAPARWTSTAHTAAASAAMARFSDTGWLSYGVVGALLTDGKAV